MVRCGLPARFNPLSEEAMSDEALAQSLDRAEKAMSRIERAIADAKTSREREERLRAKVRDVVAELDSMIEGAR